MNYIITTWDYLLYFLLGLRFVLHTAIKYYRQHEFEKSDLKDWISLLIFWPIFFVCYIIFGQRGTAIRCALYYGILPWQFYEKKKHYQGSYWLHLLSNIGYALKWLFFLESKADRAFEKSVNNNG